MGISSFEFQAVFEPSVRGPAALSEAAWWFVFQGGHLLVQPQAGGGLAPPCMRRIETLGLDAGAAHYLGTLDGVHCLALDAGGNALPPGLEAQGLFGLYGQMDDDLWLLAGRAFQILEWDRKHRYCGRCGSPTEVRQSERARQCPACELTVFPRLTPAMMALVRRDNQLLLARSPRFPKGFYSVLAGFAEPGETLEACVRREVYEEVGLEVSNIRYFGSQSWPFPHSLMVAYVADYAGGEIQVDGHELEHADWFEPHALPKVPGRMSIAGHLIEWFVREGQAVDSQS